MILSNRIFTPRAYLKMATGKDNVNIKLFSDYVDLSGVSKEDFGALSNQVYEYVLLEKCLESLGLEQFWSYPLSEANEVLGEDTSVVLVLCQVYDIDSKQLWLEPRWFELDKEVEKGVLEQDA